ncbi:MAG: hypothetical protein ACI83D_000036, partial [Planctomycetota bacterium]
MNIVTLERLFGLVKHVLARFVIVFLVLFLLFGYGPMPYGLIQVVAAQDQDNAEIINNTEDMQEEVGESEPDIEEQQEGIPEVADENREVVEDEDVVGGDVPEGTDIDIMDAPVEEVGSVLDVVIGQEGDDLILDEVLIEGGASKGVRPEITENEDAPSEAIDPLSAEQVEGEGEVSPEESIDGESEVLINPGPVDETGDDIHLSRPEEDLIENESSPIDNEDVADEAIGSPVVLVEETTDPLPVSIQNVTVATANDTIREGELVLEMADVVAAGDDLVITLAETDLGIPDGVRLGYAGAITELAKIQTKKRDALTSNEQIDLEGGEVPAKSFSIRNTVMGIFDAPKISDYEDIPDVEDRVEELVRDSARDFHDIKKTLQIVIENESTDEVFFEFEDADEGDVYFESGSVKLVIAESGRAFEPGKYRSRISFTNPVTGEVINHDKVFYWGVLAMNTAQDSYAVGEEAQIAIGVLDDGGMPICFDEESDLEYGVWLTVTAPSGTSSEIPVENTGTCKVFDSFNIAPDYQAIVTFDEVGTYEFELTSTHGHGTRTLSEMFEVASTPYEMVVRREAATRLYPYGNAPMRITSDIQADFSGSVIEKVPTGFDITRATLSILRGSGGVISAEPEEAGEGREEVILPVEETPEDVVVIPAPVEEVLEEETIPEEVAQDIQEDQAPQVETDTTPVEEEGETPSQDDSPVVDEQESTIESTSEEVGLVGFLKKVFMFGPHVAEAQESTTEVSLEYEKKTTPSGYAILTDEDGLEYIEVDG